MNKVYCFDIYDGARPIEEFDHVRWYRFKDWIVGNNAELKATQSKNQQEAIGFMMHYLNACYKNDNNPESVATIKSMYEADSQKLLDFIESSPDNGWFVFFTIEGTDLNLMFVTDLELAKKEFGF